jgi:hypothetical protein
MGYLRISDPLLEEVSAAEKPTSKTEDRACGLRHPGGAKVGEGTRDGGGAFGGQLRWGANSTALRGMTVVPFRLNLCRPLGGAYKETA